MSLLCSIGKHETAPSNVWNGGFYFSRCRHCEADMIGQGQGFIPVPKRYQVVWKRHTEQDMDWTEFGRGGLRRLVQRH